MYVVKWIDTLGCVFWSYTLNVCSKIPQPTWADTQKFLHSCFQSAEDFLNEQRGKWDDLKFSSSKNTKNTKLLFLKLLFGNLESRDSATQPIIAITVLLQSELLLEIKMLAKLCVILKILFSHFYRYVPIDNFPTFIWQTDNFTWKLQSHQNKSILLQILNGTVRIVPYKQSFHNFDLTRFLSFWIGVRSFLQV